MLYTENQKGEPPGSEANLSNAKQCQSRMIWVVLTFALVVLLGMHISESIVDTYQVIKSDTANSDHSFTLRDDSSTVARSVRKYDILPQLSPNAQCDATTRDRQAADFDKLQHWVRETKKSRGGWCFGCFSEVSVIPAFWSSRGRKGGKRPNNPGALFTTEGIVYVDIGANKGESLSDILRYFTDVSFLFTLELSEKGPACSFDLAQPQIYAVEPGPGNVELLEMLKSKLPKLVQEHFSIDRVAMSNTNGMMCMQGSTEKGNERAHLSKADGNVSQCDGGFAIKTYQLDTWLKEKGIDHVDYLKIDVEGFDSQVLMGAEAALRAGKVDLLSFEYHEIELWKTTSLKSIVDMLDSWGFSSYFIGDFYLYKMSDMCWHDNYEIKQWSNVLAVRKRYQYHEQLLLDFHMMSCKNRDLDFSCSRFGGRQPQAPPFIAQIL